VWAIRSVNLSVRWASGHTVGVRIHLTPSLALRAVPPRRLESAGRPAQAINDADLESRERFDELLRDMTRTSDNGSTVNAVMLEPDEHKLYEVLHIVGRPPDPIVVTIPDA
jgi:hypothetical protein